MNVAIHGAAAIFPMLDEAELDELAADIAKHGLLEPIVLFDEKLLDGRNRLEACRRANVEPRIRTLDSCPSPTAFVISANLHRRHLNPAQRAAYSADPAILDRFTDEAKARQRAHGGTAPGKPRNTPSQTMTECSAGRATHQAAAAFNAGIAGTEQMAKVRKRAPEVFEAVKAGSIKTVADAVRIAHLDPEAQAEVMTAISCGAAPRQAIADHVRAERIERINGISAGNAPVTGELGRFPVIYADPPWRYEHVKTESRAIENQYPTMELEAICALPVGDIATDDAVLFLWATSPKLAEAMRVIEAWGFSYRTCAAWVKDKLGMGYYFRQRHELLLVAARGSLPVPLPENRHDSVIAAPLGVHSAKPATFAEAIERMYPEHKRIELFCREPRSGWAASGKSIGREGGMNFFGDCLRASHAAHDWPGWEVIYRKAFPSFSTMVDHRADGYWQRLGINRTVVLKSSKTVRIDEKVRGRNRISGKVYDDILLEFLSDEAGEEPGWITKPLLADYIAYAILPLGVCHLLPVEQLQTAWERNGDLWRSRFRPIRAENPGWITRSVAVPPGVLYPAIGGCLRVSFEPTEVAS